MYQRFIMLIQIALYLLISFWLFNALPPERGRGLMVGVLTTVIVFVATVVPWMWCLIIGDVWQFLKRWRSERLERRRLEVQRDVGVVDVLPQLLVDSPLWMSHREEAARLVEIVLKLPPR